MRSLECRAMRQEIDELELTERPSERVAAHLRACASCREFQLERTELRELVGSLEPVVAPADFDMRLRAKLAAERSRSTQPFTFARLFSTPALAAAALFVAVSGSLVWVAQRGNETSGPVATKSALDNRENVAKASPSETTVVTPGESNPTPTTGNDPLVGPGRKRTPARGPRSKDFSIQQAKAIQQSDQAFVYVPSRTVVVGLEDEQGTTRKTSVPPVSFGAQSLVDNRAPVSYPGRVW